MTSSNPLSNSIFANCRKLARQSIILLIALLTLASCNNDDDNEDPSLSIEGIVWIQTGYEYVDCDFEDSNGGASLECTDQNCQSILFDDGTARYTEIENGVNNGFNIPYTLTGNDRFSAGGLSATYEIIGDVLTVRSFDAGDGCTLVEEYIRS